MIYNKKKEKIKIINFKKIKNRVNIMLENKPKLYILGSSICGGLTTIPLDIIQTRIISSSNVNFSLNELRWLALMPIIFFTQNSVYEWSKFLKNKTMRGILAGLSATVPYVFLEIKKMERRLNLLPKYKKFIFWITLREIVLYSLIYNIILSNIRYAAFIAGLVGNGLVYPLKLIAILKSYPIKGVSCSSIKKTMLLEILKSAIGDGITLYLVYNFKYSPFKK